MNWTERLVSILTFTLFGFIRVCVHMGVCICTRPVYCCCVSCSVISDSLWLHRLLPARLLCPWGFFRPEYWSGLPCPPPGDLPNPGIKLRSSALQADSLLSEPPGKPKNTGVGSLSLLQGIFLTQESNWDLLHCRQILYHLSYQGSPKNVPEFYQIIELEEGDLGTPNL